MDDQLEEMLSEIKEEDEKAVNGGYYVGPDRRDLAEELVSMGKVVRMKNPAGVSPLYVPMESENYSQERLEKLRDRQSE